MAFENVAAHIRDLGGLEKLAGDAPTPLGDADQGELSKLLGAPLPAALRWWFSSYGAGVKFVEPVVYADPEEGDDALVGHFMAADEIRQTLDDLEGSIAEHRLPITDDGFGNFIVVDPTGAVAKHYHDAPLDRAEHRIADSFEQFVLMLRRGT